MLFLVSVPGYILEIWPRDYFNMPILSISGALNYNFHLWESCCQWIDRVWNAQVILKYSIYLLRLSSNVRWVGRFKLPLLGVIPSAPTEVRVCRSSWSPPGSPQKVHQSAINAIYISQKDCSSIHLLSLAGVPRNRCSSRQTTLQRVGCWKSPTIAHHPILNCVSIHSDRLIGPKMNNRNSSLSVYEARKWDQKPLALEPVDLPVSSSLSWKWKDLEVRMIRRWMWYLRYWLLRVAFPDFPVVSKDVSIEIASCGDSC